MKRYTYIFLFVLLLVGAVIACERFETRPENGMFNLTVEVPQQVYEETVPMHIYMQEGKLDGLFTMKCAIFSVVDGSQPSFGIVDANSMEVTEKTEWSFDKAGRASFNVTGLTAGEYRVCVTVRRWYHSCTAETRFIVN